MFNNRTESREERQKKCPYSETSNEFKDEEGNRHLQYKGECKWEDIDNIWIDWNMLEEEIEECPKDEECNHENLRYYKNTDQVVCLECGRVFK